MTTTEPEPNLTAPAGWSVPRGQFYDLLKPQEPVTMTLFPDLQSLDADLAVFAVKDGPHASIEIPRAYWEQMGRPATLDIRMTGESA